jgi:hypothetical protein
MRRPLPLYRFLTTTATLLTSFLSGCALVPTESNPIVGMWTWHHISGSCSEVHFYKANGDAATWSGAEVLRKSYKITKVESGVFRVDSMVVESNGKSDCSGSATAAGARSTVYVRLLNGGGYFTCPTPDSLSCDGTATPRGRL